MMWKAYQTPKAATNTHAAELRGRRRINPTTAASKNVWKKARLAAKIAKYCSRLVL